MSDRGKSSGGVGGIFADAGPIEGAFCIMPILMVCLSPIVGIIWIFLQAYDAGSALDLCKTWEVTSLAGKACVYFYWYSAYEPFTSIYEFCITYPRSQYSNLTSFQNLNKTISILGVVLHTASIITISSMAGKLIEPAESRLARSLIIPFFYIALIVSIQLILLLLLAISSTIEWLFAA